MKGYMNIALFGVDATKESQLYKGSRSDSVMIASVNMDTGDIKLVSALLQEYHGGLFYFCYDAILCLLISDRRAVRPPRLLASLFLCDMASNLLDFMVSGHHLLLFTADRSAAARIVGIGFALALSRALAASTVLWFLSLREQALIHQQESARYQQLFVMAADLKTELYFLKKDAEDIEKVTLKAYQIYEQLCALPEQKALAALSLSVARDMHIPFISLLPQIWLEFSLP